MPKLPLKNRLLQVKVSTLICTIAALTAVIQFFAAYGSYNYTHLPAEVIETQLYKHTIHKLPQQKAKLDCMYDEILKNKTSLNPDDIPEKFDRFKANGVDNGSYVPESCRPLFSVAVLVTYRGRQKQLDVFLPYMHNFLRKQNIHYKIYLIEQQDEKPWNKGILYNIGAKQAINDKFPCLILHDVDLLPLDASNLYVCTNDPRHMSASIDKFRYVLTYDWLVGGVLAIKADQYAAINGFSNRFEGWGGEDDDFAHRLSSHGLDIIRFPREMSRYTMLPHAQEKKNSQRHTVMSENAKRTSSIDGLSSLPYQNIKVKTHRLFTLIGVKL